MGGQQLVRGRLAGRQLGAVMAPVPIRRRTGRAVALTLLAATFGIVLVTQLPWVHHPQSRVTPGWIALVLVLACIGELAYVRVRRGESAEDLTFYEAVVAAGVLFLPPTAALAAPLAALVLASALLRRPLVKAVFNIGSYAASTSVMILIYTALAGHQQPFTALSLLALLIAAMGFAAVNLVALAFVLAPSHQRPVREILVEEWRLSAFMAVGNVALGTVTLGVAVHAPALVPFAAMPALALGYAYQAAARGARERSRAAHLMALGATLARNPAPAELLQQVVETVRRTFEAGGARINVPQRGWSVQTARCPFGAAGLIHTVVADAGSGVGPVQVQVVFPRPAAAPGGRPWAGRSRRFTDGDSALLTSLTGTVASALGASVQSAALQEETAKLASVVEHASDGIVVLDGDGRVVLWSPAMEAITGRSSLAAGAAGPRAGSPMAQLVDALGAAPEQGCPALGPQHVRTDLQLRVAGVDGDPREVRASVSALFRPDGRLHLLVAIVHDITREQRLARLKSDFVATVSHELRTPITPIKGYARLLATRSEAMNPEQRQRAISVIEERADHLCRLVDDLLLVSKISGEGLGQLKMELAAHDLRDLVAQVVAGVPGLTGRTEVDLPAHALPAVCDPTRVQQCLTNLLTNAVRYSAPGLAITVQAALAAHDEVTVTVTDQGRGIPNDELELIFERFHRVEDSMTMTTDGSGLGLFITRELARAMGGHVSVTSALGVGSRFTLHLPAAQLQVSAA